MRDLSLGQTSLSLGYPNQGDSLVWWHYHAICLPTLLKVTCTKTHILYYVYREFIARTSIYETNLIIMLLI